MRRAGFVRQGESVSKKATDLFALAALGLFFDQKTAILSDLTTKVLRLSFSESARTAKALCISGPVRKTKRPE
jgi:hypothetical protein